MGMGGALSTGNSKLFEGPLGVVKIGFAGYDLGKTGADTNLTPDQDIKDIISQQDGTKPYDNVRTGIEFLLSATFIEINTGLLVEMMSGISTGNVNPADDSGTIGRSVYQSMRDTEADVLKIASVDANGIASESDQDQMFFYEAIPIVEGELINWGADSQRMFPVTFRIKYHTFASGTAGAFGYWGDPVAEGVDVAVWPDVEAPVIVSAGVDDATDMTAVFNEDLAFQPAGSFVVGTASAKVNGILIQAVSALISTVSLTLTFPAATFTSGDVVELFLTELCVEDTETAANPYGGVSDYAVVNSL